MTSEPDDCIEKNVPKVVEGNGNDTWHTLDTGQVFDILNTAPDQGLSSAESEVRLEQCGPNELEEAPRPSFLQKVLSQFNNFIVIVLIIASIVSAALGDYVEAAAIIAIVVLNAILGVIQEQRAEEALDALRQLAAPEAHIIRDGHRKTIPARELVPGDIVILEAGNYVPADLRLLETANLRIEEASLTGESEAVDKDARIVLRQEVPLGDRRNTAFSGTLVTYGRGKGVVVSTGMHTQIGMIAAMLQSVQEEDTPLQIRLDRLGKTLGWAALAICGVVFVVGWLRGYDAIDMFLVAVSLAVAAIPEGLPAVVTITLAIGMREMIRRHALIRKLASVETLGSTTVICSDKTGTLTQNQMTVTKLWIDGTTFDVGTNGSIGNGDYRINGQSVELNDYPAFTTALWVAALDNDAVLEVDDEDQEGDGSKMRAVGDPTEAALVMAAAMVGAAPQDLEEAYPRIDEIPFDSTRKRMTTVHKIQQPKPEDASPFYDRSMEEWEVAATKGAPDVVLDLCTLYQRMDDTTAPMTEEMRREISEANDSMSQQALRVLAVAYRVEEDVPDEATPEKVEHNLTFVGLIGMIDPPRQEVKPAIITARSAGIRTVMITGDYPNTARAIGDQIGLLQPGHKVVTGTELENMNDEVLKTEVMQTDVFARVSPEHKVRIVDALKANQQVAAMTGDGVNDAPALKRADIGVAMGITGTDVAKETADMVLTDDNYASIVAAVEQGRVIYSNIRKFVYYLLSCNVAEILVIFTAVIAGLRSPLTAIQLLWLNLVTDGAPALALGVEKGDPDIMDDEPRPPDEPVINRQMRLGIVIQSITIAIVTLIAYFIGLQLYPENYELASTMAFVTLSFSELFRAFTSRSERYSVFKIGLFSNRWMIYAVLSSLVILLIVIYVPFLQSIFDTVPLAWEQWRVILPLILIPAVVADLTKPLIYRRRGPKG
ncbi:MAG: calcium-translocating P-type ATPase, SERCA-type [Anaerolineales bacterium]|nr:calcium-translocating P-type ATPase, SERCA-type [Anaerolineales bacterium]